jgi:DNA ligase (NAD+)
MDLETLQKMEDVGIKVAKSIYEFFHNDDNVSLLLLLKELGLKMNADKTENASGSLLGQTFLFTGTLAKLKRTEAEEQIEKLGGKILSGVSSKLNYLIAGEDAGSKLEKAKKIPSIKIISEEDFLKILTN